LKGAYLKGAYLKGANLKGANLKVECFYCRRKNKNRV
jgi:uncharacterized protein YjbI with pentapeptide repeats